MTDSVSFQQKLPAIEAIDKIVWRDCASWLRKERLGSSASMNGSLDYTAQQCVEALLLLGWRPPV